MKPPRPYDRHEIKDNELEYGRPRCGGCGGNMKLAQRKPGEYSDKYCDQTGEPLVNVYTQCEVLARSGWQRFKRAMGSFKHDRTSGIDVHVTDAHKITIRKG